MEKTPQEPRPSASVILVSPKNEILLLHRVKTSSSFPSAHVFPGGNLSIQDGFVPPPGKEERHEDSIAYRHGALRELFEESGILLANSPETGALVKVKEKERQRGRQAIHAGKVKFQTWVKHQKAEPHTEGLTPFSHWITPTNVPRRFTTQMYIYFLPLPDENKEVAEEYDIEGTAMIPTSDGGKENTAAEFRPASEWLELARKGDIILFPPQFILLHLMAPYLDNVSDKSRKRESSTAELAEGRRKLLDFITSGDPPWTQKYISPTGMMYKREDGRAVLALDKPGPELKGSAKRGDDKYAVLVKFSKEGPRQVEIVLKDDVLPKGYQPPKSSL